MRGFILIRQIAVLLIRRSERKLPGTHTRNTRTKPRFARLEARISPDQKKLLVKAAALEGRSLTDFVVGSAVQEAKRIVHENEIIVLTERDREVFVAELLNPTPPNKALIKAMKAHEAKRGLNGDVRPFVFS